VRGSGGDERAWDGVCHNSQHACVTSCALCFPSDTHRHTSPSPPLVPQQPLLSCAEGRVGVSEVCILGYNVNKGQEISLRLRTDDYAGFRKYLAIRKTLVHELTHNVSFVCVEGVEVWWGGVGGFFGGVWRWGGGGTSPGLAFPSPPLGLVWQTGSRMSQQYSPDDQLVLLTLCQTPELTATLGAHSPHVVHFTCCCTRDAATQRWL
jgi:hypothetical protein